MARRFAKSKKSKTYKKKSYGRKSKYVKGRPSRAREGTIVQDKTFVKLKFNSQYTTSTSSQNYIMRANSPYDPDIVASVAQPVGFDQWAAFYKNYRVRASSIKYTYVSSSATTVPARFVCIPTVVTTYNGSDAQQASQQKYAKTKFTSTNTTGIVTFKHYMSTAKIYGVDKTSVDTQDTFQGPIGSNPGNQWYWNLLIAPLDGTTSVTGYLDVKLTYYVEFYNRQNLAQS